MADPIPAHMAPSRAPSEVIRAQEALVSFLYANTEITDSGAEEVADLLMHHDLLSGAGIDWLNNLWKEKSDA